MLPRAHHYVHATGRSHTMRQLSTFLIFALVVVINHRGGVTAQDETKVDQVADEAKNRAVTIVNSPNHTKYPGPPALKLDASHRPETRPPSKPPLFPEKPKQSFFTDIIRPYFSQFGYPQRPYNKPIIKYPNSIYQFPRVIPLPPHNKNFYVKSKPLQYVASTYKPIVMKTTTTPKFSIPVQTINGLRTDTVRPPNIIEKVHKVNTLNNKVNITTTKVNYTTTSTTTTTETTTTAKLLRTKRIWPKKTEKENINSNRIEIVNGTKKVIENYNAKTNEIDIDTSASHHSRVRYVSKNSTSTTQPTKREYRPVTRAPKYKSTTTPTLDLNFTNIEPNDWVPIVPSHYPKIHKIAKKNQTPNRRSDDFRAVVETSTSRRLKRNAEDVKQTPMNRRSDFYADAPLATDKEMMYMQSFGLIPVPTDQTAAMDRKRTVYLKPQRHSNPYYPGYSTSHSPYSYGDLQTEASHHKPRYITKIKHHHHHHHHKYVKTIQKPIKVPYKVEVPKPYPVQVEKKVHVPVEKIKFVDKPYPVTVEKKVPYPIGIKIPHPVPVKVVEKEYVPKPYPIVHHVPVVKHVQVKVPVPQPYPVEKKVPYPVEVKVHVPVDRPVPVPVPVEKQVPYPVHVKVFVPQPYPVEVKVPYPVEKKVPYPVEVEKKVPVPVEVLVPQRVEVEKRVPIYINRPYPVEKRVPYPVKVPYPVRVPVKVPFEVPVYIHHPVQMVDYEDLISPSASPVSSTATHTVTVHGNSAFSSAFKSRSDEVTTGAFTGFQSRSDDVSTTESFTSGSQSHSEVTSASSLS